MKPLVLLISLCLSAVAAGGVRYTQSDFVPGSETSAGWKVWSPRDATRPQAGAATDFNLGAPGSLKVEAGGNAAVYGGWQRQIDGIVPGHWYRFRVSYRTEDVPFENWQVAPRVEWRGQDGKRKDQPDYASWREDRDGWMRVSATVQAPEESASAILQLFLVHAPQGKVWWDEVSFEEVDAPEPRLVKVASINLRPRNTGSKEASLRAFADLIEREVPETADLILLPEGVTVVGTAKSYVEVASTVPGPDTEFLGKLAKKKNAWLVAGIYERDGDVVYNTAVLLDRQGKYVGKYRKVYLPREELEGGITPGDSYPVFQTDFGRVGMMICYDVFFPDPARALAVQGAEILLMPIWGGPERLAVARALENRVFLMASGYDHPTYVMDPDGERIASAPKDGTVAITTIDLNKHYREQWLGEMRTRRLREIRTDIPIPAPGVLRGATHGSPGGEN